MKKTNKRILEEIIRVDHAGERGAIKIYEGQLLALKTFKQDEDLRRTIEEMKKHEAEHYEFFDKEALRDPLALFQTRFLLFHCLYKLRERWRKEKKYELVPQCYTN